MRDVMIGRVLLAYNAPMMYIRISVKFMTGVWKMNGKSLGYVATDAILHMIGQTDDMFGRGATIAEIANWLNVSKPTAKRFIENELCDMLGKETHDWRKGHSVQYRYVLNGHKRSAYERGLFHSSYKVYANAILKGYIKKER